MAAANIEESWQYNKSVLERNKHMLENQLATDVTFLVGENPAERLKAHQYVLISGSPVFYSMFCGEMRETGEVTVPDVTPEAFSQMLRFLYYEEAEITGDLVMQILYVAKKYLIPALAAKCTQFLEKNLDADNAAIILEQCITFDEKEVVSKCMEVIEEHTSEVLNSESFSKISNNTLLKILENDTCSASEVELFQASVEWAKGKISKKSPSGDEIRNTLGQGLYKLRFPTMEIGEFSNVVAPTGILSKDEQLLCLLYLTQDKPAGNMPFATKPRICNSCNYIHLTCLNIKEVQSTTNTKVSQFTIQHLSSSPLVIKGFVLHEVPSKLYCRHAVGRDYFNTSDELVFHPHLTGTCNHNKDKLGITITSFTMAQNTTYTIRMDFENIQNVYVIPSLRCANSTMCISVSGNVPSIHEFLIEKDKGNKVLCLITRNSRTLPTLIFNFK